MSARKARLRLGRVGRLQVTCWPVISLSPALFPTHSCWADVWQDAVALLGETPARQLWHESQGRGQPLTVQQHADLAGRLGLRPLRPADVPRDFALGKALRFLYEVLVRMMPESDAETETGKRADAPVPLDGWTCEEFRLLNLTASAICILSELGAVMDFRQLNR